MTQGSTVELHHVLEGPEDAPVLVLSNSLGTTLDMWDPQVEALAGRFRLLRYDHRGHGGSPVPEGPYAIEDLGRDLLVLLDRLGIEDFNFGGLSVGGMVGMWVASEVPERVERLVLLCTSALLGPRDMWDARIASVGDGGMDAIADAVLERWFTPGFRYEHPEVVGWVGDQLRATSPEGYVATCGAIRDMDLRDRLGAVEAPTLLLAGPDPPPAPPDHAERIAEGVRDSRLVVIPEAAHLANIERAERVAGEMIGHLDGAR
jgi:3-oxoadipate enol-lactonase